MIGLRAALTLAAVVASATAVGATGARAAGTGEDEPDTFNVAAGTAVTAANAGSVTFTVPSAIATVTVTCTVSTFGGTTGGTLKFTVSPPVFSDGGPAPCTDSVGQADTITANSTLGKWSLREKDYTNGGAGDEGLPEPNAAGDRMVLTIPKAGLVDTNSSGCVITAAPNGPVNVTGTYNDAGGLVISNAPIPASSSAACPGGASTGTVTFNARYTLTPAIYDVG